MSTRRAIAGFALALMATIVPTAALAGSGGADRAADADVVAGSYIVVYNQQAGSVGAATDAREAALGFRTTHRYRSALNGFSAKLTDGQVNALESDPAVDFVQADRVVHATDFVPRVAGEPTPPTGIRRIVAAKANLVREKAQDNVAVIDTGINLSHPDLNAVNGKDCVAPGTTAEDENGHGTHVSGTIGAKNNGSGVTGVAPNTRIYAVRVLNAAGQGTFAQIICGIDWVSANAASKDIEVANMSLGGTLGGPQSACPGTSDAFHLAICNATDAGTGVTFVVAAGNSGQEFSTTVPAAYPDVLTVTAMSDSDGAAGAVGGAPTCRTGESDDRYASFSNFADPTDSGGQAHMVAAPGVCIDSTWLGGGYRTVSGTSMAAPHAAGTVALCVGSGGVAGPCASLAPADVIRRIRSDAAASAGSIGGFLGDPSTPVAGRYFGPLVAAGAY